jgi:hypothetical protein
VSPGRLADGERERGTGGGRTSMHREDRARQAVLPTAPFPALGPGRSCYPKRTTPGTQRAELDDLWTPTRFGNLIILRAESAIRSPMPHDGRHSLWSALAVVGARTPADLAFVYRGASRPGGST